MPLREYVCDDCGRLLTVLMSGFEPVRQTPCDECAGTARLQLPVVAVTHPKEAAEASNPKLDVVIGQGAEKLREHYRARKEARGEAEVAAEGRGVFQEKDGSFRPLTEGESKIREVAYESASLLKD